MVAEQCREKHAHHPHHDGKVSLRTCSHKAGKKSWSITKTPSNCRGMAQMSRNKMLKHIRVVFIALK